MMIRFRSRRSHRRQFSFLVFLLLITFIPAGVSAGDALKASSQTAALVPAPQAYPSGIDRPEDAPADGICLFTLRNGVCEPEFFDRHDLAEGRPLESRGHVVGVVVFGSGDLKVKMGQRRFLPIQSSDDGTFMVKGYGKVDLDNLAARSRSARSAGTMQASVSGPQSARSVNNAFYYFPKVFGDAVSSQPRFDLQLEGHDDRQVIEIDHQPIQAIDMNDDSPGAASTGFTYIGDRLTGLLHQQDDFRARLVAIAQGIKLVEDAFQVDLVQNVQLIDLSEKNNALTYDGHGTVWFYVDTVLGTSIEELRHMASHEALHQLVYRTRLTYDSQVRRYFADLWGLDDFSVARFQMVTTGWFDTQNTWLSPTASLFFSFINEKNFIRGMHGGHSQDNLDEFLTSFIHSLLYIDNLQSNLQAPVKRNATDTPHQLNGDERNQVLTRYRQSVEMLMQTVSPPSGHADRQKMDLYRFLKNRLAVVDHTTISPRG